MKNQTTSTNEEATHYAIILKEAAPVYAGGPVSNRRLFKLSQFASAKAAIANLAVADCIFRDKIERVELVNSGTYPGAPVKTIRVLRIKL